MKAPLVLLLVVVALAPAVVEAAPGQSPVAFDQHLRLSAAWFGKSLQLPSPLGGGDVRRDGLRLELKTGTFGRGANTELASRLGFEFGMVLAFAQEEQGTALGATFDLRTLLALRVWTFEVPCHGALIVSVGPEFGAGGQVWWSGPARLSPLGTVRLLLGGALAQVELEYGLLPMAFTARGDEVAVRHAEQRAQLSVGAGGFGLAIAYVGGRERGRVDRDYGDTYSHTVIAGIEWRK